MESPALVDVSEFLEFLNSDSAEPSAAVKELCSQVAQSFHDTGVLIIRDPRVNESDNWAFIDMVEEYYVRCLLYTSDAADE